MSAAPSELGPSPATSVAWGRRQCLSAALAAPWLGGCAPPAPPPLPPVRWVGPSPERGHRLRAAAPAGPAPALRRRVEVLVVGGGVAGLSALRTLVAQGRDAHALELADAVGGNSQGHTLAGLACPLGAHYLPVPDEGRAPEVAAWLHDIGLLRRDAAGRPQADERHLCHAPQERLWVDGAWQEGLLPSAEGRPATLAQYRRLAALVNPLRQRRVFTLPSITQAWTPELARLDAQPFATWLAAQGLDDTRLLGYLDHCCRDDYGAGIARVSAWAGLHYFASRHGFHAPGDEDAEREPVFTWPDGNAFLVRALARPLAGRLHSGRTALRLDEDRQGVRALVWDAAQNRMEAWDAPRAVIALPLFIAARLLADWPDPLAEALRHAAREQAHAPWLVANLHLREPLVDRLGAPPAWDNVVFAPAGGHAGLGYVDATHQSFRPHAGPTVLTCYHALPVAWRPRLLADDAAAWGRTVLADLARLHPDAPHKAQALDMARWGHAMSIPAPGVRGAAWLAALRTGSRRLHFAHSDLAGYSVFEEAFTLGVRSAHWPPTPR